MTENAGYYKKADPSEVINVGDLIMLDPNTSYIKRAVYNTDEDLIINSRLILGVCIESHDSTVAAIEEILGGTASSENELILDGGNSVITDTIIIDSGNSDVDKYQIIQVAYNGAQKVNITGYVDLGDKLCISNVAGKAKSKDFFDREYFDMRSIGKVIKFTNVQDQVIALLDIE